jgi:hypothetical protein
MHKDQRGLGRFGIWHLLALAVALLVVTSAAVGLGLRGAAVRTAAVEPVDAPGWREGPFPCRPDPMANVPNPTRFVVVAGCSTVTGTVSQVRRDPVDGEVNMLVTVDGAYDQFLLPGNRGLLRAVVVPRDVTRVTIPEVGQQAVLYGAWVQDRTRRDEATMHPVWGVEAFGGRVGSTPASRSNTAAAKRLLVRMRAPRSVPLGAAIDVLVRVESQVKDARRPEPEANLFFEVRSQDGRGVQWKAAATNALGMARVTLVALEQPGSFRVVVYVDKLGRSTVVSAPITIHRR